MDITGKTALVTGANRGLGRHLAAELRDRGARVYAAARNPRAVDLAGVTPIALDITDPASVAAAARAASGVAILVNNAGSQTRSSLLTGDLAAIRLEMDTHFFGTLAVTRAFAPQLAARGSSAVLNILSGLSWVSFPGVRRLLRRQVGGVVADQRAAPGAGGPGHPGDRAARRLHGHRHDPPAWTCPSPTRPSSPSWPSTPSRPATPRSSPTRPAGAFWPGSPPESPASTPRSPDPPGPPAKQASRAWRASQPAACPAGKADRRSEAIRDLVATARATPPSRCLRHRLGGSRWRLLAGQRGGASGPQTRLGDVPARNNYWTGDIHEVR